MAVSAPVTLQGTADVQERLRSRAIHVLCAASYLCVAVAFSYLDRRHGHFAVETVLWIGWAALGFGAGAACLRLPGEAGARTAMVLSVMAGFLAVVPGLMLYSLPRWPAFVVLLMTPARAPAMQRRRDAYLCLVSVVAVSLLVATHWSADWTVWFYLGPAWVLAALVLAWDYAATVRLGALPKAAMTLAFLMVTLVLALAFWVLIPRPHVMGFGFVPTPGAAAGKMEPQGSQAPGRQGTAAGTTAGPGAGGVTGMASWIRAALRDPHLPGWQRGILEEMLRMSAASETVKVPLHDLLRLLWYLLLLALAAGLLYRWRWRIGIDAALAAARLLQSRHPAWAMRCTQWGVRLALHRAGHRIQPGQSVQEHVASARHLPVPAARWLRQASGLYCACRFGGMQANADAAAAMRWTVLAALELIEGPRRAHKPPG